MRISIGFLTVLLAACTTSRPAPPDMCEPISMITPPGPPAARTEVVVENIHGIEVRDPYRWMEKGGPEMDAWLDAQGKHARAVFDTLPARAEMLRAVTAADLGVTRVSIV